MNGSPCTTVYFFLIIIFFGYVFKKLNILKVEDSRSIINIVLYFTLPSVVLKTFHKAELNLTMLYVFLISIGFGLFMAFIGLFIFRNNPLKNHRGLLIASCSGFNIGLFAYPFVQTIWGNQGLLYIAIFDLGNAFILFGVSYIIVSAFSSNTKTINYFHIIKKIILFVPLQSYIIAIIFALVPIKYPDVFLQLLNLIAGANSVLVLLLIGIFLSFKINKEVLISALKVLTIRYIFGITTGVLIYFLLPFPKEIKSIIMLGLILPVGMIIIPYAMMFNYNTKLAGTLVNISNVASFIIMWLIIII